MPSRVIAIGDVHGCATALRQMLELIAPNPSDTLVILGDCIDRGPDSRGVIDQVLALRKQCELVCILGNHEEMMLGARRGRSEFELWTDCGGVATLDSWQVTGRIPGAPGP